MTRVGVVTTARGRHRHLREQHRSLVAGNLRPDVLVVVPMGDDEIPGLVADGPLGSDDRVTVVVPGVQLPGDGRLPLAAARNTGAAAAVRAGAELVVFLDVDCLAGPELLSTYAEASCRLGGERRPVLLSGPVCYLPPLAGLSTYDDDVLRATPPHPARPAPGPGVLEPADARLFWSLSFAVTADHWARLPGFDEGYTGYGGEDTDFAQAALREGASMWWVGGALAYHQWHPVSDPPVEHVHDIVANANRFHRRWGWFPMEGWLDAFAALGLARFEPRTQTWTLGG